MRMNLSVSEIEGHKCNTQKLQRVSMIQIQARRYSVLNICYFVEKLISSVN